MLAHITGFPHHGAELTFLLSILPVAGFYIRRLKTLISKDQTMPCNSIQTSQLDVGKLNPELANTALQALGIIGAYQDGKLTVRGNLDVAEFKQAYSAQVVQSQARKFGWQLKQTAPNKYEVVKR